MIELTIENKNYFLPENWQEVTQKDLLIISDVYSKYRIPDDFLKFVLIRMLGIKKHLVRIQDQIGFAKGIYRYLPFQTVLNFGIKTGKVKIFAQEDLFAVSQMLHWIINPNAKTSLTNNLLPKISIRQNFLFKKHFYGPQDHLRDVIAFEYSHAEIAFLEYCESKDPEKLNDLVGILYRPKKWYWRIEKLFSDKYISARMRYTGHRYGSRSNKRFSASLESRYSVLLFFQGCRNEITLKYPYIFTTPEDSGSPSAGWAGIFRSLTNENITEIDKVLELPIHTILFDINEKIRLNKESKDKSNG